jgi:2-polyprenyl-3-methyl-5-hydroxy-6-metoxy-1,4-benzoquinol methylase
LRSKTSLKAKKKINSHYEFKGLHGRDYHDTRLNLPTVRFSLRCRVNAIAQTLLETFPLGVKTLLDVGSADGLMAEGITNLVPGIHTVVTFDLDGKLLKHSPFASVQGNCHYLPFDNQSFDVLTASAIIEHLKNPQNFLQECHRVLIPGGALFLTCPVPFFDWLATKLGYFKNVGHLARYNLWDLRKFLEISGFRVVILKKFMISPIYFHGVFKLEDFFKKIHFTCFMLNQIVGSLKS